MALQRRSCPPPSSTALKVLDQLPEIARRIVEGAITIAITVTISITITITVTFTMTITWVKAHATAQHITKGITTAEDKAGNDEADSLAEKGVKLNNDILQLAAYYQAKQHHLTKATIRIHNMFLRVLKMTKS